MVTTVVDKSDLAVGRLYIKNARLSFPSLDTAKPFEAGGKPRFGATIMIEKSEENDKIIRKAIRDAALEAVGGDEKKAVQYLKNARAANRISYKDGDESEYETNEGYYLINAYANEDRQPKLLYPNKAPIPQNMVAQVLYAGCYADFIIHFYTSDNYKGVYANLQGVMLRGDGERLGSGIQVSEDDFDDIEGDSDFAGVGSGGATAGTKGGVDFDDDIPF